MHETTAEQKDFYPRPLRGGRHDAEVLLFIMQDISIHALCEEGDCGRLWTVTDLSYFYPRPLRGGRL